jgi:hypothetical protein
MSIFTPSVISTVKESSGPGASAVIEGFLRWENTNFTSRDMLPPPAS